jgi:putative endopeptidase
MLHRNKIAPLALGFALAAAGAAAPSAAAQTASEDAALRTIGIDTTAFEPAVRPQDDFYAWANGQWLERTRIPDDRTSIGTFAELAQRSEAALREIIQDAVEGRIVGEDARKIAELYRSFMDEETIEARGLAPAEAHLARIGAIASHEDLVDAFGSLSRIGISGPFAVSVGPDGMDAEWNVLGLSQAGLGLGDRDLYFQEGERFEEIRGAYVGYIERILSLAGSDRPLEAAREIFELERDLAANHWTRTQNRDRWATYNRFGLQDLYAAAPDVSWSRYLAAAGIAAPDTLIVRQPSYLDGMNRIVRDTPLQTWREYLTFRLLDESASFLSAELADARFAFRGTVLVGLQEPSPRWRRGLNFADDAMGDALGRLYVERHFEPAARERMEILVDNLLRAFRLGIDELEWMSPDTRAEAHAKLAAMNVKIGHPEQWRDHSALTVDAADLFGNWIRAREHNRQRMIDRLGERVDRAEWFMTPHTVNAYYSPSQNEIVFPAAILQPPFFDLDADDAVNYGAIGAVIGHEISHGFDDQGRKSDGEGNLRDWWTEDDAHAFDEHATRLADQFGTFSPLEGMHLNGRLSLGENIGDLSGLAVAHRAYRLSLGEEEAPVLGGFTGDQRFFLGWAQIWRIKYREEALRQLVLTGPHSPGEYRVNGIVRNLPAFHEAFDVQEGDGMYLPPEERVRIW